jgi:AraC family transcriptional regulator
LQSVCLRWLDQCGQPVVPSQTRQVDGNHDQELQASVMDHGGIRILNKEINMKVTIIDCQPTTIAYFRYHGPYGESIAKFWQETYVPWAVRNKLGSDHARYGISHDDPSTTAPNQCRYDACAEVAPDFMATGGALKSTIPGGKYAVLRFKGTVGQIGEAWASLLRVWLPSSGLQLDDRPSFEYYPKGATYDSKTGEFECELCIPVIPL